MPSGIFFLSSRGRQVPTVPSCLLGFFSELKGPPSSYCSLMPSGIFFLSSRDCQIPTVPSCPLGFFFRRGSAEVAEGSGLTPLELLRSLPFLVFLKGSGSNFADPASKVSSREGSCYLRPLPLSKVAKR